MQNRTDPIYFSSSIIGMDVFTPHFPDLPAFKHMLLTGKIRPSGDPLSPDKTDSCNAANELQILAQDAGMYGKEGIVRLVVERALQDADLGKPDFDGHSFIVILHQEPEIAEKSRQLATELELLFPPTAAPVPVHVQQTITLTGSFKEAEEKAHFLLDNHLCSHVALCSLFSYSMPSLTNSSQIDQQSHQDDYWGFGCLVLSRVDNHNRAYASMIWSSASIADIKTQHPALVRIVAHNRSNQDRFPQSIFSTDLDDEINIDHFNPDMVRVGLEKTDEFIQKYSHPVLKPFSILWLITTALSLNTRTHFTDPIAKKINGEQDLNETQTQIRPWFLPPLNDKRESDILLAREADHLSMLWLEKKEQDDIHPSQPFFNFGRYLLPISFYDAGHLEEKLSQIREGIEQSANFTSYCADHLTDYIANNDGAYTLALQASSRQELLKEMDHAGSGVQTCMRDGKDWQTPGGSFFTPRPLGPDGKIAFVYPGAFGTYIGMGQEVFYLFPRLHSYMQELSDDPGNTINESVIYPRPLTSASKDQLQRDLNNNPIQMISSGICFSYLFTVILRDILKIKPGAAFGYSLGEISMLFATGAWTQADAMRTSLEVSPIFHERVSSPQNAVREFWNVPAKVDAGSDSILWANYILLASPEKVNEAISREERVYITHINAPRQVVIGGAPSACLRVASSLNCMYLEAPYRHAIHCPPVQSEYNAFQRLHDWPVEHQPDFPVYSAADYAPIAWDAKRIADGMATMLTHPIDFPRLVEQVYADGARIFIELGAGNNCSKWVEAILKGRPHAAVSINANNVPDHISILSMLARLISHRVSMDLGALVR